MRRTVPGSLTELFDAAAARLVRERRRTRDELHALDAFVDELRSIPAESVSTDAGMATTTAATTPATGTRGGLRAVRDAYEETVMAVPHYAAEYGDTYGESVGEELGPDLETALVERSAFDAGCKRAVLSAATSAQRPREALIEALDAEADDLETARESLLAISEEVTDVADATGAERGFGTLDAYRARLSVLEEHCDGVAADRQATLRQQRRNLRMPVAGPDLPTYAYQLLDVDYPVLAAVTAVLEEIESARAVVERAMAYCN